MSKTERQLNLLFVLLNASQALTKEQIRARVPGYDSSGESAFAKMFERDKKDLRELGIPIKTVSADMWSETAEAYRIDDREWLLPTLDLSPEERAILAMAASSWEQAQLGQIAQHARDAFADPAPAAARLGRGQRLLPQCLTAISSRRRLHFHYRAANTHTPVERSVDPWRIVLAGGRWYLVGFDFDREAVRTFRIDRIVGDIEIGPEEIDEECPPDFDLGNFVDSWDRASNLARIRVRPGTSSSLRTLAIAQVDGVLEIPFSDLGFLAALVVRAGTNAVVLEPASLRDEVCALLNGALARHS